MTFLNIAAILSIGLMIGTELAVSVFINPIIYKLEESAQAAAIRLFAKRLGTAMPFWYVASLLLLIVEAVLRRGQPGFVLLIGASAIWVAVVVLTISFLVPINNRMMRLEPGVFARQAKSEHKRWDRMHRARVAALAVSFVFMLLAVGV